LDIIKKTGVWANGILSGPGEIVHADHKVAGNWLSNEKMGVPAKIVFPNGYVKEIWDQKFVDSSITAGGST
jgi:hypothetical protein